MGLLEKLFGNTSAKEIKRIEPIVLYKRLRVMIRICRS